ncbi:hypothetical protein CRYUN_Cryun20dG0040200 [Craigia yunnanensis]
MSTKKKTTRTRVGKYELGRTLGEGSFAMVKFAKNVETGECVAIKILDRDHIKREISTVKLIKHPNVLKIFEVNKLSLELWCYCKQGKDLYRDRVVDGGELFDKIAKHGRLKEEEARSYFRQLIDAVDYCHSRGVYHRDLKPENLLQDSYGVLKILDFLLSAFSQQEDGLLHTACGTPNYVAPEVLKDQGYNGTSSDIWSCGVILFVLMAGYLPFDEPNLIALYKKRITIPEILPDEWFKRGYKPPQFEQENVNLYDVDAVFNDSRDHLVTERKEKPVSMNAFELISRSQSFSIDNLFEKQTGLVKRETSFASQCPPNESSSKLRKLQSFWALTFTSETTRFGFVFIYVAQADLLALVFEVAPCLHMVELRKTGGDTLEFHKFYKSFSSGLKDIVWKSEEIAEE